MKKLSLIAILSVILWACSDTKLAKNAQIAKNESEKPLSNAAQIKFEADTFNFGVIRYGEKISHEFKFTNIGNAPLLITGAQASCGCTVARYPREAIEPGGKGVIEAVFNSIGKSGNQIASITISSNSELAINSLRLTGEIIAATGER